MLMKINKIRFTYSNLNDAKFENGDDNMENISQYKYKYVSTQLGWNA